MRTEGERAKKEGVQEAEPDLVRRRLCVNANDCKGRESGHERSYSRASDMKEARAVPFIRHERSESMLAFACHSA